MIWFSFLFILFSHRHSQALLPAESLKAPAGFKVQMWGKVPGARSLAKAGEALFVGTGGYSHPLDRVYRVLDWNRDGSISDDEVETLIEGLDNPNGVAIHGNDLFVAEHSRILQFEKAVDLPRGKKLLLRSAKILNFTLPKDTQHGWRYIRFALPPDDDWLYVAVGAPCNVCVPPTPQHAAIHRLNIKTGKVETVARGVRNSVGMAFHPKTGRLWFTDNGRDNLGDDEPPDELNEVISGGAHFGYPYCYGAKVPDGSVPFDKNIKSCGQTIAPKVDLGAHVAALGMRFYTGRSFPPEYRENIFIAEHGSWNRSRKSGFRVTVVKNKSGRWTYEPFVTGWLDEKAQSTWGRPSDLEVMDDGALIISDDGFSAGENPGALFRVQAN